MCVRARVRLCMRCREGKSIESHSEELATLALAFRPRSFSFARSLASPVIGREQGHHLRAPLLFNACALELRGGGIRLKNQLRKMMMSARFVEFSLPPPPGACLASQVDY